MKTLLIAMACKIEWYNVDGFYSWKVSWFRWIFINFSNFVDYTEMVV